MIVVEFIRLIWTVLSQLLGFDIRWKHLICGFIGNDITMKIRIFNLLIVIVMYTIFKQNSRSKFDGVNYKDVNIDISIKNNLHMHKMILEQMRYDKNGVKLFVKLIAAFNEN